MNNQHPDVEKYSLDADEQYDLRRERDYRCRIVEDDEIDMRSVWRDHYRRERDELRDELRMHEAGL